MAAGTKVAPADVVVVSGTNVTRTQVEFVDKDNDGTLETERTTVTTGTVGTLTRDTAWAAYNKAVAAVNTKQEEVSDLRQELNGYTDEHGTTHTGLTAEFNAAQSALTTMRAMLATISRSWAR